MCCFKAQVTISLMWTSLIDEGTVLQDSLLDSLYFEKFCVSFFAVTADYLFSKYRFQALAFKIPASYGSGLN